jgi:hypothetical protein
MLYEHPIIMLKRKDERAGIVGCRLVKVSLNAFIDDLNFRTTIKCFDRWIRRGLGNHIDKVLSLKKGIFRI